MSDKSTGIDFDRQTFVQQQERPAAVRAAGLVVALVVIVAVVLLGYKLLPSVLQGSVSGSADPTMADLDKRLAGIETRLDKLETSRRAVSPAGAVKKEEPAVAPETKLVRPVTKTVYQISPAYRQPNHVGAASVVTASTATADSGVAQHLPAIQQGLEALQNDTAANREAWQATTDRLADMAGQVGTQNVEILQSQDELNQLLAQTQREAIPFELVRGSNPQPVGPVSLALKASNPKTQRYTVCVYAQPSCIELKDHTLHEVVQFVVARNTTPLEFIATKIMKDEVLGYLEVPRDQVAH